ncbi:hypothetical protein HBF26_04885 [Luteibacter jiangsuensis]|uniref:Bulb-type lectin domain-containing protein n=1 Tax=Luteibacter jiangsuensis TaxID=637577 RepID=A0ABX0Q115_9GAMM|nr:hypothetical protein [Luteibacter jiangsuensis]NID04209.1 hypothetical protein [Luteibacter jiangsuensis]
MTMVQSMKAMAALALGTSALLFADATWSRVLNPGESILVGQTLPSDDGRYYATLQADGNFVVYQNYGHRRAVWSTRTANKGAVRATMEHHGDFALFDASNNVVWRTKTNGPYRKFAVTEHGQAMVLTVRDWWTSGTSNRNFRQEHALIFPYGFVFEKGKTYSEGMYSFSFQIDGNVVVRRHGVPIWATYTNGATHASVDLGLVVTGATGEMYSTRSKAQAFHPANHGDVPGTRLFTTLGSFAVFPDGNVVAYRAAPVWFSHQDWHEGR